MFWGLIVNGIAVGSYFAGGSCQIKAVTVYPCVAMFASYAWLFSKLYFDAKKPRGKAGKSEVAVRAVPPAISADLNDTQLPHLLQRREEHGAALLDVDKKKI